MCKKNFIMILLSFIIITSSLVFSHAIIKASGTTSVGWKQIGGIWYYTNSSGTNVKNTWEQDSSKRWFYLGTNGAMVINTWAKDSSKRWFYLGSDGAMVTNTWAQDSSKHWYYLGTDGAMVTNTWAQDSLKRWFYLGTDGAMVTNTMAQDSLKHWCYLGTDGAKTIVKNTWKQNPSKIWFYFGGDGNIAVNSWAQDSLKHWFYLGADGAMATNTWAQDSSKRWFYLGTDGAMETDTLAQDSSMSWCYLGTDGAKTVIKNMWKQNPSKIWFYFDADGNMAVKKWAQDSSKRWYYLGSDGAMVTNTMAQDSSKQWFYLGTDGAMVTNTWTQNSSKTWFYFGADGAMVTNKWVIYNGKSYYLNNDGDMAASTTTPDGFKVGVDGALIVSIGSLSLNKTTDKLAIGRTDTLIASIDKAVVDATSIKWTSSNSSIVEVNNAGIISALSEGTAIISAISADGSSKAFCAVTVTPKMTFAIDIGHNTAYDGGAVGIGDENTMNMEVGNKVIAKLKALGYNVISVLPSSASSLSDSLIQRVNVANQAKADLYVSIHFNKFDGTAHGTEVWIGSESSRNVATNVLNNIVALGYTNRGVKVQGIDGGHLYVLNNTIMPALLVEGCFLDNISDMDIYNPENIANAIVNALIAGN